MSVLPKNEQTTIYMKHLRVSLYIQRETEYKKEMSCDEYEERNLRFAHIMHSVGGAEGCHSK